MKQKPIFIVTVDTELDDTCGRGPAWGRTERIELKNLAEIPRFQDLCERYGVIPTYLITYECTARDEAVSVLKPLSDAGNCEIGHHLHCWTTPPFQKEGASGVDSAWLHAYQSELPDSLFFEKSEVLYRAIEKVYGKRPTSHRAGRWGIDQRSIDWLIDNNFLVDSSVVPLTNYRKRSFGRTKGGSSFYSAPQGPYLWYGGSINKKDNACLVEIPLTVDVPLGFLSRMCVRYIQQELPGSRLVDNIFRKIGGGKKFRIDPRYPDGALSGIVDRVVNRGMPVLNLMLHSSELALGCSPFSRTKDDYELVWKRLEEVFKYIKNIGIMGSFLSGAVSLLEERNSSRI